MEFVAVISASGQILMPTNAYKARKLLKRKKAVIHKYKPLFTIQLVDREEGQTQPIEFKMDTGYQHIGISIASQKHEFVNEQRDLLKNETEKHNDCRKYRRTRRNRLRHRKARWKNRKNNLVCKDGFAPSLRNKRDMHIQLYKQYLEVLPITKAVIEMGQFDTQVLKAIEENKPIPQGKDYQYGEEYGYATLREAVFNRDGYKCICCGKGIQDGKVLTIHHLGYRIGDRSNRMSNLGTACTDCHTSTNHKKGGKLYNLKPRIQNFKGATYMSSVRWDILNKMKAVDEAIPLDMTYGAMTMKRRILHVKKSHSNDAYCMGDFHPKHRSHWKHYQKRRRNNRILSKFYDAKYMDIRDDKKKSGCMLSCNRTNRRELRLSSKNERIYRGHKVSKGRVSTRRCKYSIGPGDIVKYKQNTYTVVGLITNGKYVKVKEISKNLPIRDVTLLKYVGGWQFISHL